MTAGDIHSHNSFANPHELEPKDAPVNLGAGGRLIYRFAPASVTRLQLMLT